ncbi:unnamed protein product (mitochondrion) [Plasmodiophora brassicae]|uniref:Autophagy-related protein 2 n=1 Tax=Plasmodiophora brassicae TaxID=37360 RepID=A0A0G4IX92_PLABS|nr:hypothetical protein PBRA_007462 [Plasmodiophora brassicae]SPQ97111.1 unnamed protein product [Plasmodiophora brassicae]
MLLGLLSRRFCQYVLKRLFGQFLDGGDLGDLRLLDADVVSIRNVALRIPRVGRWRARHAVIGHVKAVIPWRSLLSGSCSLELRRVEIDLHIDDDGDDDVRDAPSSSSESSPTAPSNDMESALRQTLAESLVFRDDGVDPDLASGSAPGNAAVDAIAGCIEGILRETAVSAIDVTVRLHFPDGPTLTVAIPAIAYADLSDTLRHDISFPNGMSVSIGSNAVASTSAPCRVMLNERSGVVTFDGRLDVSSDVAGLGHARELLNVALRNGAGPASPVSVMSSPGHDVHPLTASEVVRAHADLAAAMSSSMRSTGGDVFYDCVSVGSSQPPVRQWSLTTASVHVVIGDAASGVEVLASMVRASGATVSVDEVAIRRGPATIATIPHLGLSVADVVSVDIPDAVRLAVSCDDVVHLRALSHLILSASSIADASSLSPSSSMRPVAVSFGPVDIGYDSNRFRCKSGRIQCDLGADRAFRVVLSRWHFSLGDGVVAEAPDDAQIGIVWRRDSKPLPALPRLQTRPPVPFRVWEGDSTTSSTDDPVAHFRKEYADSSQVNITAAFGDVAIRINDGLERVWQPSSGGHSFVSSLSMSSDFSLARLRLFSRLGSLEAQSCDLFVTSSPRLAVVTCSRITALDDTRVVVVSSSSSIAPSDSIPCLTVTSSPSQLLVSASSVFVRLTPDIVEYAYGFFRTIHNGNGSSKYAPAKSVDVHVNALDCAVEVIRDAVPVVADINRIRLLAIIGNLSFGNASSTLTLSGRDLSAHVALGDGLLPTCPDPHAGHDVDSVAARGFATFASVDAVDLSIDDKTCLNIGRIGVTCCSDTLTALIAAVSSTSPATSPSSRLDVPDNDAKEPDLHAVRDVRVEVHDMLALSAAVTAKLRLDFDEDDDDDADEDFARAHLAVTDDTYLGGSHPDTSTEHASEPTWFNGGQPDLVDDYFAAASEPASDGDHQVVISVSRFAWRIFSGSDFPSQPPLASSSSPSSLPNGGSGSLDQHFYRPAGSSGPRAAAMSKRGRDSVELQIVDIHVRHNVQGVHRTRASMRSVRIADDVVDSRYQVLIDASARPSTLDLEWVRVRNWPSDAELRARVALAPLVFSIDGETVRFLTAFVADADGRVTSRAVENDVVQLEAVRVRVAYVQWFHIACTPVTISYRPRPVDIAGVRASDILGILALIPVEGVRLQLQPVELRGIAGLDRLAAALCNAWAADIVANQTQAYIAGIQPFRSLVNVGGALRDLVFVPALQLVRQGDERVPAARLTPAQAARQVTMETVNLMMTLVGGAHSVLSAVEDAVSPQSTPGRRRRRRRQESRRPHGFKDGCRQAYASLAVGVRAACESLVGVPSGDWPAAVPRVVLEPALGATRALNQTLQGLRASLDPAPAPATDPDRASR